MNSQQQKDRHIARVARLYLAEQGINRTKSDATRTARACFLHDLRETRRYETSDGQQSYPKCGTREARLLYEAQQQSDRLWHRLHDFHDCERVLELIAEWTLDVARRAAKNWR